MNTLFNQPLKAVSMELHSFIDNVRHAEGSIITLNWQLPAQGDIDAGLDLASLLRRPLVEDTSQIAMARYLEAQPVLVDVMLAKEAIPAMAEQKHVLYSGPPIAWEKIYGPVRGAIIGTMLYEGWATSRQDTGNQVSVDEINLTPCHHYHAVGPVAGIISPSMPLWVIENRTNGHRTFSDFNESLDKVLRFGANNDEVLNRLAWMCDELAPIMKAAIAQHDELEPKPLMAQTLHMEGGVHNRNAAATGLLIRRLLPALLAYSLPQEHIQRVMAFITGSDHFFLSLSMAAYKAMMDAAANVPFSSMVTMMARNGANFGIRLSGTGDRWSQAPINAAEGLFFPGSGVDDAAADLGGNAITETAGVGGFAMASSPTITRFVGGTPVDATNNNHWMQVIILGGNPTFTLPTLNFTPTVVGIDARKVADRGILPVTGTGIAHRQAGVGQISAGITITSMACFIAAVRVLAEIVAKENHHG